MVQRVEIQQSPHTDLVNHPAHYQSNGMEAIDVIEAFALDFALGNAVKYLLRAGKKGDAREDLKKAIWYIQRRLDAMQEMMK